MEEQEIQFQSLKQSVQRARNKAATWRGLAIIFLLTTLAAVGYLLYAEYEVPLFGRWKNQLTSYDSLQREMTSLQQEVDSLQKANDLIMETSPYYTGVFYEVQIGAFQNFNLNAYKDELVKMNIEEADTLDRFTIGKFRDFEQAQAFKRDIARLGIEDAFIVAKIDGVRVPVRQARGRQRRE